MIILGFGEAGEVDGQGKVGLGKVGPGSKGQPKALRAEEGSVGVDGQPRG